VFADTTHLRCAALNGIDPAIIARADDLVRLSAQGEDLVASCSKMDDRDRKELEIAVSITSAFPPPQEVH
jgi:DNA mismatch repair protein MSH5